MASQALGSQLRTIFMKLLQLTLETPAENLALDEALLDAAEAGEISGGVLRLWESPEYCVVLGRSSRADLEVDLSACREANIAVLRRSSGGGTIVAGPGCLMYAVVLDFKTHPQLRAVDLAHQHVLEKLAKMLAPHLPAVSVAGISDLVIRPRPEGTTPIDRSVPHKISGNALRVKRNHFLYHGTLLYDFDLNRLSQLLDSATREPDYRDQRSHFEFVSNLPMKRDELIEALIQGWNAESSLPTWPQQRVADLVRQRYAEASNWAIFNPRSS
jgi:lipoate-protein ligase A